MAYLVPIHRPSSIRHAIKCNFLSPDDECLVVAKSNRLEFYTQSVDGLSLQYSKTIYGKVVLLQKFRPSSSGTDHLVVGTDRFVYFTISWNQTENSLRTEKKFVDVAERSSRESQTGERCLIDPTGRILTMELYEGILNVVPIFQKTKKKWYQSPDIGMGDLTEPIPYRISEMFVRSSAFLFPRAPQQERPKLALLYEDSQSKLRLQMRYFDYPPGSRGDDTGNGELEIAKNDEGRAFSEELELGASHLIPIPEPIFGLLVLGETSITYVDDVTFETHTEPLEEATIFVAWEKVDDQRFVLADDYGKLYLLMLIVDEHMILQDWRMDALGITSRASTLVYLDAGHIFVGSHQGDSQVVKILEKSLEVVQTFPNIAPILDFTVMDMGNRSTEGQTNEYSSGQTRIVTGSGAYKDGSLRSVRSGVGLEDLGVLGEMGHISALYSLKSDTASSFQDTLVVSFINETRIFHFGEHGDVEEADQFKGMALTEPTLLASNLPGARLLQVTDKSVRICELRSGVEISEWSPVANQPITAAAANDQYAVVSIGGTLLITLSLRDRVELQAQQDFGTESQVACVAVPPGTSSVCFVGFWQDSAVSVLSIENLRAINTVSVADGSVPRALLLTQIFHDQPPTLFIAMADGHVITYSVDMKTFALSGKKGIILGTQQPTFSALARGDGQFNVFATCEHPSLIYGSEGRLVYSAVTADKAVTVCSFDSSSYPGAIAIATPDELRIAMVDTERTTHVQTLLVNETVRRIAYSPNLRAFGMGTIKRTLHQGMEIIQSHFKVADEVLFKELDTFKLNQDELVESVIRCELDAGTGDGALAERFVVGTAYLDDDRADAVRGRIIVFELTEDRMLKFVTELETKGGCRCLSTVNGKIVAALIKTVVVYSFHHSNSGTSVMEKRASYRTSTAPVDIYVDGFNIIIADLMKSISIVQFTPGQEGLSDSLVEVARHYNTIWSTAVVGVDEDVYLQSDCEGNLMVLYRDQEGATEEDRKRLLVSSELLLGEMVNRIRRTDVAVSEDAPVMPRAFLATVEGSIYLFALIAPRYQNLLMSLQSNLANQVVSLGEISFNKYRAFKNQTRESEDPDRFVDGDLIECFLDLDHATQQRVVAGLGTDVEEVKALVEQLKRLH